MCAPTVESEAIGNVIATRREQTNSSKWKVGELNDAKCETSVYNASESTGSGSQAVKILPGKALRDQ